MIGVVPPKKLSGADQARRPHRRSRAIRALSDLSGFVRFNMYVEASSRDGAPHLDEFYAHAETDKAGQIGQSADRSAAATGRVREGRLFNCLRKAKGDCLAPRRSDSATIARYELRELARLEIRHDPVFDVVRSPVDQVVPLRARRRRSEERRVGK